MPIESDFDVAFIARQSLREKQIQQNYRPIIAVHKWFARRPGTLFRGLMLAEFGHAPLRKAFYQSNDLHGVKIGDPFMGGGTPLFEANRLGCDVLGFDINPMAYWIVKQEIEHLDLSAYKEAADSLLAHLASEVGRLYQTRCVHCGRSAAVKYFLWVKVLDCEKCRAPVDLFPGYLVAENVRHPRNVYVCSRCGELNERAEGEPLGKCERCRSPLTDLPAASRNRCLCPQCGHSNRYPRREEGAPRHRLFAMEYHCPACRAKYGGRFFKAADKADFRRASEAEARLAASPSRFVPDDEIPAGDETDRLHKWGYRRYREMFNTRQLLGLELSARWIAAVKDQRVRNAMATNLSDLLRYQNMLCRYDTMALKSLDIFSVHGFPVGLIQCESNLIGIGGDNGASVGSGGWTNVVAKFSKAKEYADHPFEIRHVGKTKITVPIEGEWIGDSFGENGKVRPIRKVDLRCGNAATVDIPRGSLDAVFTDPPYFGNVQYAELMDFCYVWLRKLVDGADAAFNKPSTRDAGELTGNVTLDRGLESFASGLSAVFGKMAKALKPGGPLAFTFHHNELPAYAPVALAILDAALTCTATLPCPAEMSASIHITGTKSSIVDSVFVCRSSALPSTCQATPRTSEDLAELVHKDIALLAAAGRLASTGDILCVINGHLARVAVSALRKTWSASLPISDRLARVTDELTRLPAPRCVKELLDAMPVAGAPVGAGRGLFDIQEDEKVPLLCLRRAVAVPCGA
jgi:adenine-specific DNA methylase